MYILKHQGFRHQENTNVAKREEWAFKVTKMDSKRHFEEAYDVLAQE